ncbi:MAG: 3-hydroxyacyl-CoA dehydrogenase NAD-binding domain-containing protein [Polyangiales bacterium]
MPKGARRPKEFPRLDVKKVGVLGAGLMGQGIAQVAAAVGIDVVLLDQDAASAERGKEKVKNSLMRKIEKGRTTQEKVDDTLKRILPTSDYGDLKGCEVVIEAVLKIARIKAKVTKSAEAVLDANAVFASNTSGLAITSLAQASSRPENFIGMHFFSPVEKMQMVEVIMGEKTSQETLAKAWDFILKIRKAAIVVNDSPGFYTSRVFGTFITEGNHLLVEGVAPALIENAAKAAGMPMPPLGISDQVGLLTMYKVAQQAKKDAEAKGEQWNPSPAQGIIAKLIEVYGRYGANPPPKDDGSPRHPAGFYEYFDDGKRGGKRIWSELQKNLSEFIEQDAEQPSGDEVKRRYLFTQCLEAARCFEEGVITNVRDGDVGVIMAVGFPAFTGGPFTYMDNYGIGAFVDDAKALARKFGARFEPPKSLREMARNNQTYYRD